MDLEIHVPKLQGTTSDEQIFIHTTASDVVSEREVQSWKDAPLVGIDFETFSSADITKGVHNYTRAKDFAPLVVAVYTPFDTQVYDFVQFPDSLPIFLSSLLHAKGQCAAHNAAFELSVLRVLYENMSPYFMEFFVDSAVDASIAGASRSLDGASQQLLGTQKLPEGRELIKLFSVPNAVFDFKKPTWEKISQDPELVAKWELFKEYCLKDAELSLRLHVHVNTRNYEAQRNEQVFWELTEAMNQTGWTVDLDMVKSMQRQYEANNAHILEEFYQNCDPTYSLNLNSSKQLQEWCAARGVKAKSFNEAAVEHLLKRILQRIDSPAVSVDQKAGYVEVSAMLKVKQQLGGSSLKKLQTILDQTDPETAKLHGQYMHLGASQTYRTSGRGVQLQNLKRLKAPELITSSTMPEEEGWSNEKMASQLRQVFTASDPKGQLIVGDFSSVESRGLAWLAEETWKLDAYFDKKDLYKVMASRIFGTPYEDITKAQRQIGKVGELSCGYGAGAGAVESFAAGMGVPLDTTAASKLVADWRETNPLIVEFWDQLHRAMVEAVRTAKPVYVYSLNNCTHFMFSRLVSPRSLEEQHPGVHSLSVTFWDGNEVLFSRLFHGVYMRGRDVCFYKPSSLKSGKLWKDSYMDPKTKRTTYYKLYGGKLAGILTQSLCRELFFNSLFLWKEEVRAPQRRVSESPTNVKMIGQFHDEIVIDWKPPHDPFDWELEQTIQVLQKVMSTPRLKNITLDSFPLEAAVAHDYRYIK